MPRQPSENKASQAVADANGTVLACSLEILSGILNDMRSSAKQYWLYAPRPLISPLMSNVVSETILRPNGYSVFSPLTSPNQASHSIPLSVPGYATQLNDLSDKIASKDGSVAKGVSIK